MLRILVRDALINSGYAVTAVMDLTYIKAIYFRREHRICLKWRLILFAL
jgi:hypothetical protein